MTHFRSLPAPFAAMLRNRRNSLLHSPDAIHDPSHPSPDKLARQATRLVRHHHLPARQIGYAIRHDDVDVEE